MMLAGPELRAVPVTIHIPLSEVPVRLNTKDIVDVSRITADELRERFAIRRRVWRFPASTRTPVRAAPWARKTTKSFCRQSKNCVAEGGCTRPLPADTMFHPSARASYDAAICMYHDQALIPAKALAFDETVNVTLGLPFIRTSPDHGTAFDIAGKALPAPTASWRLSVLRGNWRKTQRTDTHEHR